MALGQIAPFHLPPVHLRLGGKPAPSQVFSRFLTQMSLRGDGDDWAQWFQPVVTSPLMPAGPWSRKSEQVVPLPPQGQSYPFCPSYSRAKGGVGWSGGSLFSSLFSIHSGLTFTLGLSCPSAGNHSPEPVPGV